MDYECMSVYVGFYRNTGLERERWSVVESLTSPATVTLTGLSDVVVGPFTLVAQTSVYGDLLQTSSDSQSMRGDIVDGRGDRVVTQHDMAVRVAHIVPNTLGVIGRFAVGVTSVFGPQDELCVASSSEDGEEGVGIGAVGRAEVLGLETEDLLHGIFNSSKFIVAVTRF